MQVHLQLGTYSAYPLIKKEDYPGNEMAKIEFVLCETASTRYGDQKEELGQVEEKLKHLSP